MSGLRDFVRRHYLESTFFMAVDIGLSAAVFVPLWAIRARWLPNGLTETEIAVAGGAGMCLTIVVVFAVLVRPYFRWLNSDSR